MSTNRAEQLIISTIMQEPQMPTRQRVATNPTASPTPRHRSSTSSSSSFNSDYFESLDHKLSELKAETLLNFIETMKTRSTTEWANKKTSPIDFSGRRSQSGEENGAAVKDAEATLCYAANKRQFVEGGRRGQSGEAEDSAAVRGRYQNGTFFNFLLA